MSSAYPNPARPRTGWRTLLALVLIAFVLGIGATALFLRQYRQWLPRGAQEMIAPAPTPSGSAGEFMPPPEVGTLPPSADEQMLAARQATLAGQLAALEARTLEVDRESRAAAGNAGRAEAVLALAAARRAIDRGQPLGPLEPLLRARFGATQSRATAAILVAARRPVTLGDLRLGLDAIAADLTTGTNRDGWWAGFRRELAGLIVIRRENQPSPRPSDRLMRARQLIDAGQVHAALAEISRMPRAPSATAWIEAARRYVEAHDALDMLENTALLSPPPAPPAPTPAASPTAPSTAATATTR